MIDKPTDRRRVVGQTGFMREVTLPIILFEVENTSVFVVVWLVGGWSVCHNILKGQEVSFACSYALCTCFI